MYDPYEKNDKDTLAAYAKKALSFSNKIRTKLGFPKVDKLYPGNRQNAFSCAVTNTIYDDDITEKYVVVTGYYYAFIYEKLPNTFMGEDGIAYVKNKNYAYPVMEPDQIEMFNGKRVFRQLHGYWSDSQNKWIDKTIDFPIVAYASTKNIREFLDAFDNGEFRELQNK